MFSSYRYSNTTKIAQNQYTNITPYLNNNNNKINRNLKTEGERIPQEAMATVVVMTMLKRIRERGVIMKLKRMIMKLRMMTKRGGRRERGGRRRRKRKRKRLSPPV